MMYRLIVDTETDILQSLCEAIVSHLLQKYGSDPSTGCSVRLQKLLNKTLKDEVASQSMVCHVCTVSGTEWSL